MVGGGGGGGTQYSRLVISTVLIIHIGMYMYIHVPETELYT